MKHVYCRAKNITKCALYLHNNKNFQRKCPRIRFGDPRAMLTICVKLPLHVNDTILVKDLQLVLVT